MPQVEPYSDTSLPQRFLNWLERFRDVFATVPEFLEGTGTPEGNVTAKRGTRYFRTDGAAGTFCYVKTTTTGNTGWIAYA